MVSAAGVSGDGGVGVSNGALTVSGVSAAVGVVAGDTTNGSGACGCSFLSTEDKLFHRAALAVCVSWRS